MKQDGLLTQEEFATAKAKLLGLDAPSVAAKPAPERPPPARPQPIPPTAKAAQPAPVAQTPAASPKPAASKPRPVPKTPAAEDVRPNTPTPAIASSPTPAAQAGGNNSVKALASQVSGVVARSAMVLQSNMRTPTSPLLGRKAAAWHVHSHGAARAHSG